MHFSEEDKPKFGMGYALTYCLNDAVMVPNGVLTPDWHIEDRAVGRVVGMPIPAFPHCYAVDFGELIGAFRIHACHLRKTTTQKVIDAMRSKVQQ